MKKFKTFFVFVLTCILLCISSATTVFAASETRDGIKVEFNADKTQYLPGENIKLTLSVTNTNNFDVENVELKDVVPDGYCLSEISNDTLKLDQLSAGQTVDLSAELVPVINGNTEVTSTTTTTTASTTSVTSAASTTSVSRKVTTNSVKKASSPKTGDNGIGTYIIVFLVSGVLLVLAILGKKKIKSTIALVLCIGIAGTASYSFIGLKTYAVVTHETKSISLSETIQVDGSEVLLTATVTYDLEISENDNLRDDIIDLGDIQTAVSNGDAEVVYNEYGDIISISGSFTDKTVSNTEEAAELLHCALPLFGDDFSVDASNITVQSVTDETAGTESFYKYSPVVNGVSVLGSQIILSTDKSGNVTSLNSTYNDKINQVNTDPDIAAENAQTVATDNLLSDEAVDTFLNKYVSEEHSKADITDEFLKSLNISSNLIINNLKRNEDPALMYQVRISSQTKSNEESPEGFREDEEGIEEGIIEFNDEESDSENTSETSPDTGVLVDKTYLIYANGENCGNIYSIVSNIQSASNYSYTGKDLKGNKRAVIIQGNGKKYWLRDATRNIETYKTTFGDLLWIVPQLPGKIATDNALFGINFDKTAISVHANMTDVYDYYYNKLGRKSFDGKGATIISSYDYDDANFFTTGNYENAFWTSDSQQFVFGDSGNFAAAKDVIGHEFTHAVINYVIGNGSTTSLTYYGESGALNEAYADIMGSIVESKPRTDSGRWTIAEDSDETIRDMSNPTAYGQPDNYSALSDPAWSTKLDKLKNRDHGGVHVFNSVFTHATYKMITDSRTSSISDETWAKIFYRSLYRLSTNATFLDARGAVLCSAKSLGFDNEKQQAIKDAFDFVGITEADSIRIVLKWGSTPDDLDSHLVGPSPSGTGRFHVYFSQRSYYADGSYNSSNNLYAADLDYDDTTSYGPKITTIHSFTPGTYYFYVHDYTNQDDASSTDMAKSGANVTVYSGNNSIPSARYTIDPKTSGTYWNVFKITIDSTKKVKIEEINTYYSSVSYS